jgi:hypothetical protein
MSNYDVERASLDLLCDIQTELCNALTSLGGRQCNGLLESYIGHSARLLNKAVEAYIFLRESGRLDASKLLVRTVIEAVFRVHAVRKKPELMYRIAYSEHIEDKKWVRPIDPSGSTSSLQSLESNWQEFKDAYRAKYSDHQLKEEELSLLDAAKEAGLHRYYDSHYRLYCRFTHASFRASTGGLDDLRAEDNRTMSLCAFAMTDALKDIGATAPHLAELKERLSQ